MTLQPNPAVEFTDRYTLALNSYKRHSFLRRSIVHYSQCAAIDAIRVIWCEGGLPPTRTEDPQFYSETKEVRTSSNVEDMCLPPLPPESPQAGGYCNLKHVQATTYTVTTAGRKE